MPDVRFSVWPIGARDNASAHALELPWSTFAAWVTAPVETDDKHASAFSPLSAIRPGKGGRIDAGSAGFLAFEYDDAATPALFGVVAAWASRHDAVIYTTASATPERPRFRVVVRPSRPIEPDEWRSCIIATGLPAPAPESYQASRIWYRPITRGTMPPVILVGRGAALDVDAAVKRWPPAPRVVRPPKTEDELAAWPLQLRIDQAWAALGRRRDRGAFAAACVAHDHGLPLEYAEALVLGHGHRCGWTDIDAYAIADRVAHAYEYARDPFGCALVATVETHPDLLERLRRSCVTEKGR